MALQITPNTRPAGNLSITANSRARMSSVLFIDWDHITGIPDGITAIGSATGIGLLAIIDVDGHGATRTITPPAAGITVTDGNGAAGNPTLGLANDLAALEGLASTGIGVRTATDTWEQRTLQPPAAGITITNPAGVAGDPTLVLANDLAALEGLASTGLAARTATDAWAQRTITAPAAGITITNPAGVAGNPTLVLANDLAAVEGLASNGMVARTATDTWTVRTITAGASMGVTNGDGIAGNPTIALTDAELVALAGLSSAADSLPYFTGSGTASLATFTAFARTLVDDATQGAMQTTLGLVPGTNVQAFDADLAALAANSTDGLWAHTGAGTGAARTLTAPAAGITVTNPAGIAGNPTLVLANDLAAVEGLGSTGIARRTGTDAWSVGTAVSNAELAAMAAFTFKGNNTSGSAVPTDVDIAALTTKASPAAGDYAIISDQAASGAWKKATVSSLASAGSVASINGQTGALTLPVMPQGRLTLQTVTPVMTTTQSAKTTIFYTSAVGNQVPLYDGTNFISTTITGGEISVATTDTAKSAAAIGASKVNDWFVWNDAGTIRVGHGPDWSSDSARTDALTRVNGILLNAVAITNGPAASRGTYVGTTRSNASSQLDWIIGGSSAGGTAAFIWVWNMYNRRPFEVFVQDSNVSWAYTSATWRSADNSTAMRISFVRGQDEDGVRASYSALSITTTNAVQTGLGVGLDSTSALAANSASATTFFNTTNTNQIAGTASYSGHPGFGAHFLQALESGGTGGLFNGVNGAQVGGLYATIWH